MVITQELMFSLDTVGARLVGQQQHSSVLNLPDGPPALVIDSFVPAVFYVLPQPLSQPFFAAGFADVQNPFVFASGVLLHQYIYGIKRGGRIGSGGFKLNRKALWSKDPINTCASGIPWHENRQSVSKVVAALVPNDWDLR